MLQEPLFDGLTLCCEVIPMGRDYLLSVYGGDTPHVGSVCVSAARPSRSGEGLGVSTSVINGPGHKDEAVGRRFSEAVALQQGCTAVCACGIHIDHITSAQIGMVQQAGERLLRKVLASLQG